MIHSGTLSECCCTHIASGGAGSASTFDLLDARTPGYRLGHLRCLFMTSNFQTFSLQDSLQDSLQESLQKSRRERAFEPCDICVHLLR